MRTESQKRFARGWSKKRKEIEIFLIDNENERLNNEYGKNKEEDENDFGIGVGRYPPDYLDRETEENEENEKLYKVLKREGYLLPWQVVFESKSEYKAKMYVKKSKKKDNFLTKITF